MNRIRNEKAYDEALERIEEIIDSDLPAGSQLGDELELLTLLVNEYEEKIYHIASPDPIDAIRFRMEQQGLKNKDLIPYIGSESKVSEIIHKKRPLTLHMIRRLHTGLGIPAEVLIVKK